MASNRDALRRLTRRFPAPPEVSQTLIDLMKNEPPTAAIIGAALADAALEQLLSSRFVSANANLIGRLFNNRGPLSDFDSKILIAQAFGHITSRIAAELQCVKAIRNAFAHAKSPLTFEHELIDREIWSMKIPTAIRAGEFEKAKGIRFDNQAWYLLTIQIILSMLEQIQKQSKSGDEALADALREP